MRKLRTENQCDAFNGSVLLLGLLHMNCSNESGGIVGLNNLNPIGSSVVDAGLGRIFLLELNLIRIRIEAATGSYSLSVIGVTGYQ